MTVETGLFFSFLSSRNDCVPLKLDPLRPTGLFDLSGLL